jgi:gliding motility associated protien GldN
MKLIFGIACTLLLFIHPLSSQPISDIVTPKIVKQKSILEYPPVAERDIMWKKYIWRILDVRERMNLKFAYFKRPFFQIISEAAQKGELATYDVEDDQFSYSLSATELSEILYERDTVEIMDQDQNISFVPIENGINSEAVKRYRIKEVWYFDSHYSVLKVRILGIAPLIEVFDEAGNFKYERPLFWIAYNELRPILAREPIHNEFNDASTITWEDCLERRDFASTIIKKSNVHDRKIEDYLTGVDRLLEAEKIRMEIFNFEHDLWSY